MLIIKRSGPSVQVQIDTDLPYGEDGRTTVLVFSYHTAGSETAELFRRYLSERLRNAVRRAREAAYAEGYKDGRQHQRKETMFRGDI